MKAYVFAYQDRQTHVVGGVFSTMDKAIATISQRYPSVHVEQRKPLQAWGTLDYYGRTVSFSINCYSVDPGR